MWLYLGIFEQEYGCLFVETVDHVFSYEEIESAMSDDVTPLFGPPNFEEAG